MKTFHLFFSLLFAFGALSLIGCADKTGDLTVVAENLIGERLSNKTIYLYANKSDFDNAKYTKSATTDGNGKASFLALDPQTYWIDCDFTVLGIDYTASGTATVEKGSITTVTITP